MVQVNLKEIKSLRKQHKYTQEEMAKVLGHKTLWSYWRQESGEVPFTAEQLFAIANLFQVPIECLYCVENFAKKVN